MNDNFLFYGSWLDIIESNYPDDINKQNELIRNIVFYGIRGIRNDTIEKMFTQQVFVQIDSAKTKHEKRVEAGRKGGKISRGGGAPKGNKNNASGRNQHSEKRTTSIQQANDNVNDNVNVNVNDNDNVNLHIVPAVCAPLDAAQPSVRWEVRQDENGETRFVKIEHGGDTT